MGLVTAAQAQVAGVRPMALVMMARRGTLERVSHGVYRVVDWPAHPLTQYMQATLWPVDAKRPPEERTRAVLSHETALALWELSDVSPATVHVTVPPRYRVRRAVPRWMAVHRMELSADDVTQLEGMPIVTPARAIRDGLTAHMGAALLEQAIDDGVRTGRFAPAVARALRAEVIASRSRGGSGAATSEARRATVTSPGERR